MKFNSEIRRSPERPLELSCRYRRAILGVLIVTAVLWVLTYLSYPDKLPGAFNSISSASPKLTAGLSYEEFRRQCLMGQDGGQSIQEIYATINALRKSHIPMCEDFLRIFDRILSIEEIVGEVVLPEGFVSQVRSWLGNKEELFQQIYHQKIYQVDSFLTGDKSVFNPLRSKRPILKSGIDIVTYVDNLVNSTGANCDFCRYKNHTAADVFGRIESEYSATASNTFKLAKFHALFFPYGHHPLHLNHSVLVDLFITTANHWFEAAAKLDPTQRYPTFLWDSLPHGGASQVHPHVHGLLDNKKYQGNFDLFHKSTKEYYNATGRFLWPDFIHMYKCLGLIVEEGDAVAVIPITARKDHEYWILAPELNEDVVKLIGRILNAYTTKLNAFCHSAAGVLPLLGIGRRSLRRSEGLPLLMRIGSRGDCTSVGSDVSSLELYAVNNINSDLAQTAAALKSTPWMSSYKA